MKYLQEAANKVSAVKNQSSGTTEGSTLADRARSGMLAADEAEMPTFTSVVSFF